MKCQWDYIWWTEYLLLSGVWHFATPWTVACQAPPSEREYWSGFPFPSPGDFFPTQGSNLGVLHCRQTLYHLSHQGWRLNSAFKEKPSVDHMSVYPQFPSKVSNYTKLLLCLHKAKNISWQFQHLNIQDIVPAQPNVHRNPTKVLSFGHTL